MKPRYSFSSRHTRRAREKNTPSKEKFPEILKKVISNSDIILEILDARFPDETRNKDIEKQILQKGKKIIYILHKSDLVSKKPRLEFYPFVYISSKQRQGIKTLRNLIKRTARKIEKPVKEDKITVGVIGYPNTGKSSLINLLIGKSSAGTGHEAGFTKGIQKLKLTSGIVLLDSPGVIPKKEYSQTKKEAIAKYAKINARSYTQIKDPEIVFVDLMKELPELFEKFYKIDSKGNPEILIEELGKRKGLLKKGGIVDEDRTARLIIKDLQLGNIKI